MPGLDRPLFWGDIADLDMTWNNNAMITRLLLPPDAPFPQRTSAGRKVKIDAERRIVTIRAVLPRKMKPQDFADLIGRYRQAAEAQRILAIRSVVPPKAGIAAND